MTNSGLENKAKVSMSFIWVLGIAAFLVTADMRAISPILPAVADYFQVREATAGLMVTAYSIPYGLFQLFYGPLAERIGKLQTIVIAVAMYGFGTILSGFMTSFQGLLFLRFIDGMFAAGIIPIAMAYIGDSVDFSVRQKALGQFFSMSTSGQVMGMVIGGIITQFIGWQALFIILGLAALPAAFLINKQRHTGSAVKKNNGLTLKEQYQLLFSSKGTLIVYGLVFFEGLTIFTGFTYLGAYVKGTFGLSYSVVGLILALFSASALVSSFLISSVLRKVSQRYMPFFGATLMATGYGVIWLSPTVTALCIGLIFAGAGYCFCHTTLQTFATELLPQGRATAMSFFSFSIFMGSGIGPIWLGFIYDVYGAEIMLEAMTISLIMLALLSFLAFKLFFSSLGDANPEEK